MDPLVIVGGGTAGSVVARAVASESDIPIVLVEAGGITDDDQERFLNGLTDDVLWPGMPCPQARALGGGSAVNGLLLTGEEPTWLSGLTRTAERSEAGSVGRALLDAGGRLSRLWWNNGRWNPARAVLHLAEEGRVDVVRGTVEQVLMECGAAIGVMVDGREIRAGHVVMCAGAILTPMVLRRSGVTGPVGEGLQNHPTVSFTVERPDDDMGRFDAACVFDIVSGDARGLLIAYERTDAVATSQGLVTVALMNPVSRGAVADAVEFGLLSDARDRAAMDALVESAARTVARMGLTVVGVSDPHPVSHPTSSCAFAADHDGAVLGIEALSVADASVLPTVPPETPAASVTINALRIGRRLGRRLS